MFRVKEKNREIVILFSGGAASHGVVGTFHDGGPVFAGEGDGAIFRVAGDFPDVR